MTTRRSSRRITLRFAGTIDVELELDGERRRVRSRDVSLGGLCLRMERPPAPDTALGLTLHVPGGEPITASGRVRWVNQRQEVGIQFEEMAPEAVLVWARWLKELER